MSLSKLLMLDHLIGHMVEEAEIIADPRGEKRRCIAIPLATYSAVETTFRQIRDGVPVEKELIKLVELAARIGIDAIEQKLSSVSQGVTPDDKATAHFAFDRLTKLVTELMKGELKV